MTREDLAGRIQPTIPTAAVTTRAFPPPTRAQATVAVLLAIMSLLFPRVKYRRKQRAGRQVMSKYAKSKFAMRDNRKGGDFCLFRYTLYNRKLPNIPLPLQ